MANLPGLGSTIPGVWAISNCFSIERIEGGYYIKKYLGYDGTVIEFKGSSKEIAKQLIASLKDKYSQRTVGNLHTFNVEPFTVYLPELECGIDEDIKNDQKINVDDVEVDISNEMKKLKHLLIFL